jgi:hypothetical protein
VRRLLPVLLLLAAPVGAQEWITVPEEQRGSEPSLPPEAPQVTAAAATGGVVRVLDKINGTLVDLELANGETEPVGSLSVTMGECRYPADNPAGDAFALVSIRNSQDEAAVFEGWLIASAPALNALDHPRYDVWALRCLGV